MIKYRLVKDNDRYYVEKKIGLFSKWYPQWGIEKGIQESFKSKSEAFREYGRCDMVEKKHSEPLLDLMSILVLGVIYDCNTSGSN